MLTIAQLFRMLFKWARNIRHYRSLITLAIISGLVSGLASTSLLAVINSVLTGHTGRARTAFIALCVLIPLSAFLGQWLLVRLTARASYDVRMQLARQILAAPYV